MARVGGASSEHGGEASVCDTTHGEPAVGVLRRRTLLMSPRRLSVVLLASSVAGAYFVTGAAATYGAAADPRTRPRQQLAASQGHDPDRFKTASLATTTTTTIPATGR